MPRTAWRKLSARPEAAMLRIQHTTTIAALVLAAISAPPGLAQSQTHIIKGRVSAGGGVPVSKADVIVTMAPTTELFSAQTNAGGEYTVVIPNGSGEYLLYIAATGRR